jgi:transposase
MLRITVTDDQRRELQQLRRQPDLRPLERDRVEAVLLAAAGWSAPRIAAHLNRCAVAVRTALRRFQAGGPAGLRQQPTGPPPATARRAQVTAALDRLLDQDRTWTAAQLATALGAAEIALSTRQTRKYLQRMGAKWRRVQRTLRHKQDPVRVERATTVLASLEKKPSRAG